VPRRKAIAGSTQWTRAASRSACLGYQRDDELHELAERAHIECTIRGGFIFVRAALWDSIAATALAPPAGVDRCPSFEAFVDDIPELVAPAHLFETLVSVCAPPLREPRRESCSSIAATLQRCDVSRSQYRSCTGRRARQSGLGRRATGSGSIAAPALAAGAAAQARRECGQRRQRW
jgi:hypothetical protein